MRLASVVARRRRAAVWIWVRSAVLQRPGERAVAPDLRRQPVGSRARVVIEADRRLLARRDSRIRLPVLAVADQPEDDERHRDHRHDDDEHEEQPQTGAEAGQAITEIADGATVRHLPRRSVPTRAHRSAWRPPPFDAPDGYNRRSTRGYSSVGRAPGSHPGGRGFESRLAPLGRNPRNRGGFVVRGVARNRPKFRSVFRHQCLKTANTPLIRVDRWRFRADGLADLGPRPALSNGCGGGQLPADLARDARPAVSAVIRGLGRRASDAAASGRPVVDGHR